MSYIERERQRGEALKQDQRAVQEEQLDWLHNQHEELVAQTALLQQQVALLSQQNRLLLNVATHTRVVYILCWAWVVGGAITAAVAVTASEGSIVIGILFLVVASSLITGLALGTRNREKVVNTQRTMAPGSE